MDKRIIAILVATNLVFPEASSTAHFPIRFSGRNYLPGDLMSEKDSAQTCFKLYESRG